LSRAAPAERAMPVEELKDHPAVFAVTPETD
jgi:hypothetical protein